MAAGIAYKPARPLDNADLSYAWRKRMARIEVARALREVAGLPTGDLPPFPVLANLHRVGRPRGVIEIHAPGEADGRVEAFDHELRGAILRSGLMRVIHDQRAP